MGESNARPAAGVVLTGRRTRVWVERGALHWKRGRTTVVVPGARIRRVEAAGRSLTVILTEGEQPGVPLTVRHRQGAVVAALGAEIEAIVSDAGPSPNGQRIERRSVRAWPVRVSAGVRDRVLHGSPWWRRACWYVALGLPLALWVPTSHDHLGLGAWVTLPVGLVLLRVWVGMADLDTRWVMWRRGVTVRAQYKTHWISTDNHHYIVRFRTLDGRSVTARTEAQGHRDEITYDPRDPSRVLARTRVAWLATALAGFLTAGMWGVALSVPAVLWLIEALSLPFSHS